MLFITPSTSATEAKDYYTRQLAPSDYYTRDMAEMPGQWHGMGAELLGLKGEVRQKDFFALCDNQHPETGDNLTRNTQANRRVLYDFTFDAPKSVSLAYELAGDERILESFQSAVSETMAEMEGGMMARVRAKGADEDRVTANMVWAGFTHRTTRPVTTDDGTSLPDPQLHCHATVFNATYDTFEQKWKAAQFGNLVRDKGYYQAAFHSRLAGKLSELGYGIERDGNSFRLAGIGKDLTDRFSRRTEIIEAEAQRLGVTDPKAKGEVGRRTREKKSEKAMSMSELKSEWLRRLSDGEIAAIQFARTGHETSTLNAVRSVDYALLNSFEHASVVTEKELLKTALIHSVGNASVGEVKRELLRDNVVLKPVAGQVYATTKEVCHEEMAMLAFVRNGQGRFRKLGGANPPELDPQLSAEQRRAVLTVLNSRDAVIGIEGGAGTGKTRTLRAIDSAVEQSGKKVFAFAPSAKASRGVLREEGFAAADTVERLLTDAKLQHAVHGQVVLIDEAGLLSTKDMKRVFDLAEREQARVILSGDVKQHSSVARGDALRLLKRDSGMTLAELKEVRRQTGAGYKHAVTAISEGDVLAKDGRTKLEHGIEALDKMGAIIQLEGNDRYRHIAADYIATTSDLKKDGEHKTALVVSPTHAEAERVTDAIRAGLKQTGRMGAHDREYLSLQTLGLTEAERTDGQNYAPGNVIQFVQNAKGYRRGERVTVKEAGADGITVIRENGRVEPFSLAQSARFQAYEAKSVALSEGDRIRITQNGFSREARLGATSAKGRLNNGDTFEVAGFEKNGDIRLRNGFIVPKDYGGLTHGFVVTSHASQGSTVDKVLIALGTESLAAANRQQLYVSVSRGREAVRLYTDDKAAVMDAVRANPARLSATELMQGVAPVKRKPSGIAGLMNTRTIQRAYNALKERIAAWTPPVRRKEISLGA
jgi:conjugative relaxase-like TrwC/TraI family protein